MVQKKPTGTDTDRTETAPSSFQPRTNSARADTRTEPFRTASARRCGARRDSRRAPEPLGAVGRARRNEALPGRGSELRRSRERRQHGTERRYPERSGRGAPNGRRSGTRGQPRHRHRAEPGRGRNRSGASGQRRSCAGRWEAAAGPDVRRSGAPCGATSGATAGSGPSTARHGDVALGTARLGSAPLSDITLGPARIITRCSARQYEARPGPARLSIARPSTAWLRSEMQRSARLCLARLGATNEHCAQHGSGRQCLQGTARLSGNNAQHGSARHGDMKPGRARRCNAWQL